MYGSSTCVNSRASISGESPTARSCEPGYEKSSHRLQLRLRLQNGLYQREKLRPEGRQIDTPCRPRKDLTSDFFFQERNAVGQGRLRNVALFGRLAEGTLLCGGFCEPGLPGSFIVFLYNIYFYIQFLYQYTPPYSQCKEVSQPMEHRNEIV